MAAEFLVIGRVFHRAHSSASSIARAGALVALAHVTLAIAARPAHAIDPHRNLGEYSVDVWRVREGLPGAWIRGLVQTSDGYLWIGSQGGLGRYGGGPITTVPADPPFEAAADVMGLYATRDGTIWVMPSRGHPVCFRDGFRACLPAGPTLPSTTSDDRLIEISEDRSGRLYLATTRGIFRLHDGALTLLHAPASYADGIVAAIHCDARERLFVGTSRGLFVGSCAGASAPALALHAGPAGPFTQPVAAIFETPRGELWVAGERALLHIASDGASTVFAAAEGLPDVQLTTVLQDRDGNVWLGSHEGLVRFRQQPPARPSFARYTRADGLPDDDVSALLEDREGSLWVGTRTGGLAQFNDRTLDRKAGPPSLMDTWTSTVAVDDDGVLWAGTALGLTRFAGGIERTYTRADGLPSNQVLSLCPGERGELWVGTDRGLARFRNGRFESVAVVSAMVTSLFREADGTLWVGSAEGIVQLGPGGNLIDRFAIDKILRPLDRGEMRGVARDDQGVMWTSANGRLLRLQNHAVVRDPAQRPQIGKVRALVRDTDGTVWLGTGDGLVRHRKGTWRIYGAREGLSHRDLYQVVPDDLGYLWIGANHGVLRVRKSSLDEVDAGTRRAMDVVSFEILDQRREVRVTRARQPGVWKSRDGRLHFATGRGVVSIDPRRVPVNTTPPPVFIERAVVDGRTARSIKTGGVVNEFPPGFGAMEFHFAAITLLEPGRAQHRYRLEGFDADWVDAGTRRSAYYTNMKPGRYRFRVQGSNADGVWNEVGDTLELTIAPHFYQTSWFFVLVFLGVAGLVLSIHRLRVEQLRGRYLATAAERSRVARELHDSLLQGMAATLMHLRGLRKRFARDTAPAATVADELRTIEQLVATNIEETRQFVWDLRDRTTEEQELGPALAELLARVVGKSAESRVVVEGTPLPVPRHVQRELMRVAHEALVNARSHAGASHIEVRLCYEEGALSLAVQDDGRGFDPQAVAGVKAGRFGVTGMRERAEMLGRFSLETKPGAGTKVEVNVNLKDLRDV